MQVSKLQEREKEKRSTLEKIKALKRSIAPLDITLIRERQDGNTLTTEDDFDVELETADVGRGSKRPKTTREKRNEKYGFGGNKRKIKRNDDDAGDLSHFDKRAREGFGRRGRGGKRRGGPQRLGKQRRMKQRK